MSDKQGSVSSGLTGAHIQKILQSIARGEHIVFPCESEAHRKAVRSHIAMTRKRTLDAFNRSIDDDDRSSPEQKEHIRKNWSGITNGTHRLKIMSFRADPDSYDLIITTKEFEPDVKGWWDVVDKEEARSRLADIEQRTYEKRSRAQSQRRSKEKGEQ